MKKYILIIITILMCFGCRGNYQININKDLSVDEEIIGLENQKFYDKYYNSSKERIVNNVAAFYDEVINNGKYIFSTVIDDSLYGGSVSKKYSSIDDYYNNSIAYRQYFASWRIDQQNSIIEILLDDKLKTNGTGIDRYYMEEGTVNVTLPFKVLDHNADKVVNNTYSWNIDSKNGDKIYLKFDSNKLRSSNSNYKLVYILFFSVIVLAIVISLLIFIMKHKRSKKF